MAGSSCGAATVASSSCGTAAATCGTAARKPLFGGLFGRLKSGFGGGCR